MTRTAEDIAEMITGRRVTVDAAVTDGAQSAYLSRFQSLCSTLAPGAPGITDQTFRTSAAPRSHPGREIGT